MVKGWVSFMEVPGSGRNGDKKTKKGKKKLRIKGKKMLEKEIKYRIFGRGVLNDLLSAHSFVLNRLLFSYGIFCN